jgi:hypothetical protein
MSLDYSPSGTARDVRNVLKIRKYWAEDELKQYMLDLGIVSRAEDFEIAVEDLVNHGYASTKTIDGRSYLSSSLPGIP